MLPLAIKSCYAGCKWDYGITLSTKNMQRVMQHHTLRNAEMERWRGGAEDIETDRQIDRQT